VSMGDHVVAQGIGRGTHRGTFQSPAGELQPSGRAMQANFCAVYRLKDGRIVRADSYFDFYGLLLPLAPETKLPLDIPIGDEPLLIAIETVCLISNRQSTVVLGSQESPHGAIELTFSSEVSPEVWIVR
jgi:hypothetical protein